MPITRIPEAASATASGQCEQTGLELRHGHSITTIPDAQLHRHRDAGLRRPVHDQRGLLRAAPSRSAPVVVGPGQLPRERHRVPRQARRTGENCLIATKAMIPLAGPVREGVGLLGSPCFEIPRTVQRDTPVRRAQRRAGTPPPHHRQDQAQPRHHRAAPAGALRAAVLGCSPSRCCPSATDGWQGWASTTGLIFADLTVLIGLFTLADRAATGFRPLRPRFCSIYQLPFWRHERYWKVPSIAFMRIFDGTPFKAASLAAARRADGPAGVRRRLRDHRAQPHQRRQRHDAHHRRACSRATRSRTASLPPTGPASGPGCTVGTGAFVHYAVTMERRLRWLEADAFADEGRVRAAGRLLARQPRPRARAARLAAACPPGHHR